MRGGAPAYEPSHLRYRAAARRRRQARRAAREGLAIGLPGGQEDARVLDEIKTIDGVATRVVEDRELKNGRLIELTRDYYAIDAATNDWNRANSKRVYTTISGTRPAWAR
jgi:hypothetical protein